MKLERKRRCIGCNEVIPIEKMIKITKDYKTQNIVINPDNYCFGRSVYVCHNKNCIDLAMKKDRFSRNLKKKMTNEEKENIKVLLNDIIVVQQ